MSEFHIELESGTAVRLPTAGKYCDRDILVSAGDEGYHLGLAEGEQAAYDRFWDDFQQKGKRQHYAYAFAYAGWSEASFHPQYPIAPVNPNGIANMFTWNASITDTKVPITAFGSCQNAFNNATNLKRIPKLIFSGATNVSNMFLNCGRLEELYCEGEITLSMSLAQSTKLTKVSIESIINALSATASGQTLTLSATAVTNAFGSATAEEWTSLIGGKSNWTISLV